MTTEECDNQIFQELERRTDIIFSDACSFANPTEQRTMDRGGIIAYGVFTYHMIAKLRSISLGLLSQLSEVL